MSDHDVPAIRAFNGILQDMLNRGQSARDMAMVEPPMSKVDIADLMDGFKAVFPQNSSFDMKRRSQYPIIETAIRDKFNRLVATKTADSIEFFELWDLFDIILVLSDEDHCDPTLLLWLVEELLDSETIAGCRKVFDYLESRRERITAKPSSAKNLVILRTCNELLRRLSRADDTAFCGRVFIFLFQSFPLGDKSSVNLRGEYHTENVTTFDHVEKDLEQMDMDVELSNPDNKDAETNAETPKLRDSIDGGKGVTFSTKESPVNSEELYPTFWSMQQFFNQPTKLFDAANFTSFKSALESTLSVFKTALSLRSAKAAEEATRKSKRKRSLSTDDLSDSFNPKYLTSRDLFDLEIRDIVFQRNILVQVLIVCDFLLSLSSKSKEKLAKSISGNPNKSVMYAEQTLSEENTQWVINMKKTIADYIKRAGDGPFFYRMVETVLSRDKNWAWWKIRGCPPIEKPAISPEEYIKMKAAARKTTASKRLRPNPIGSLDLAFLNEGPSSSGLDRLKDPSKYELPSVKSFKDKIDLDDMDIDMAPSEDSKNKALESKASKSWRALRIASTSNLAGFDKIEKSDKIDEIFKDKINPEHANVEEEEEDIKFPKDRRPVVISGPSGVGKGTLVTMLLEKHPKVFGKKASHTTRKPREGEIHGVHYYFVSKEEFNILRDGDEFLEYNTNDGNDYGTSGKVVQGIIAKGKVPIMGMDYHGIQQLKDNSYSARFIFLSPPSLEELQKRLVERGTDTPEKVQTRLEMAKEEIQQSEVEGFHDQIIVNDILDASYSKLEAYIFGEDDEQEADGEGIVVETAPVVAEVLNETVEPTPMETEESAQN